MSLILGNVRDKIMDNSGRTHAIIIVKVKSGIKSSGGQHEKNDGSKSVSITIVRKYQSNKQHKSIFGLSLYHLDNI